MSITMPPGSSSIDGRKYPACLSTVISPTLVFPMKSRRILIVRVSFFLLAQARSFGNGGAWQTGVPVTGNGAATDQKRTTNVTIEEEKLSIDLHQEFAALEVRYRMRNSGGQVEQDFFFPVERWAESDDRSGQHDDGPARVRHHRGWHGIEVGKCGRERREAETGEGSALGDFQSGDAALEKSSIPFAQGQTREILIHYRSPYCGNPSSVSDDGHSGDAYFRYSLSPAATWKGQLGKAK